ncbi:PepSY domain-containing protein [Saccharibacillus kuerlensis]|uniref:PepSY domain-containing protein n=1 Tax=Saccharibacillus kuerlensis TaxID=459527 RepID=A0ABQ2L736_9BACL|nr:PepSY domain-containing protein [Saccharibacillus kuerlensis]GGO05494.1 hypothetical protein GCM10010969_31940 [Saccharibacillus kuerlensis]
MKRITGRTAAAAAVASAAAAALILWSPWDETSSALTQEQAKQQLLTRYSGQVESAELEDGHYNMLLRTEAGLYTVALSASDGRIESIRRLETTEQIPEILDRMQVKEELESRQSDTEIQKLELQTPADGSRPIYAAELTDAQGRRLIVEIDAYSGDILSEKVSQPAAVEGGEAAPNPESPSDSPSEPDKEPVIQQPKPPSGSSAAGDKQPGRSDEPARLLTEQEAQRIAEQSLANTGSTIEDSDADLRTQDDGQAYYLVEVELANGREAAVQINAVSGTVLSTTWNEDDNKDDKSNNIDDEDSGDDQDDKDDEEDGDSDSDDS